MNVLDVDYYEILEEAYLKHNNLIVAFDFDNTVFDYHKTGLDCTPIIDLLKRCDRLGFTLICFTSELNTRKLNFKSVYLEHIGLRIGNVRWGDVNKGDGQVFPSIIDPPTNKYTKPYANIYLDDKAGLKESYERLNKLVTRIENKEI